MSTALLAGARTRLGRAVATRLAADGWRIVELTQVTDLAGLQAEVRAAVEAHGPVGALVNAAGDREGAEVGAFLESGPEQWTAILDLHLRGAINAIQAALPSMIAAKRGSIVTLAAIEGVRGAAGSAVFSAAKGGVVVLAETLVRELQPYGIRVNTVLPGNPESLAKTGTSDDAAQVAGVVAFLLSEGAAGVTGTCIDVTAGWALY